MSPCLGRVTGKVTQQKFALQLYSRLTNANPELVLVFMQAGSDGAKQVPQPSHISRLLADTHMFPHQRELTRMESAWHR